MTLQNCLIITRNVKIIIHISFISKKLHSGGTKNRLNSTELKAIFK